MLKCNLLAIVNYQREKSIEKVYVEPDLFKRRRSNKLTQLLKKFIY